MRVCMCACVCIGGWAERMRDLRVMGVVGVVVAKQSRDG
jgi:hypothetical protein